MKSGDARLLLGFDPQSRPTASQIKAAYKNKVWDVHPDRFPAPQRTVAESRFKLISEAYTCLLTVTYTRVVRTGVPRANGGGRHPLVGLPFLFIILGTIGLGGLTKRNKNRILHIIPSFPDQDINSQGGMDGVAY
ncbi:hypothetical protein KSS87_001364 [Heliosperma pusillum]|nr:hypothetical protein KSS87_001364 [Heliosperma pusillum]